MGDVRRLGQVRLVQGFGQQRQLLVQASQQVAQQSGELVPPQQAAVGLVRESEINQEGKARKLWDIEEGKGI